MSGWRFCVATFLLFTGLSASPAVSNPLAELLNPAPKEAAPPAPVKEECLAQPGKSTGRGEHWVYRLEGHRKCWFPAAGGAVSMKKQVRHHTPKRHVIVEEEDEAELRKAFANARAQLLRAEPADASRSPPPAPEVVDAASAPANGTTSPMAAASVVAEPTIDQPVPDRDAPRQVDVEMLLAEAPAASDAVASSASPATPRALSIPDISEDRGEWMATQAGIVLIALGLISLLGALLASRFREPRVGAIRLTS